MDRTDFQGHAGQQFDGKIAVELAELPLGR